MPERPDEGHVSLPEPAARLDVDRHLSLVAPCRPDRPRPGASPVDGPVPCLRGKFVVGAIQRHERGASRNAHPPRCRAGRRAACLSARSRASPGIGNPPPRPPPLSTGTEILSSPNQVPRRSRTRHRTPRRQRLGVRRIGRGHQLEQRSEVMRATVRGKGPDILHSEVRCDLADPPWAQLRVLRSEVSCGRITIKAITCFPP